ncbi:hypothetical protein D3C85_1469550 [compost metagenome]
MIMKVAVPPEKHSPRFGQEASSQTLCSLCLRSSCLIRATSGDAGISTRIQSGLRGMSSVGMIFTGMRATFSAPRSFTPACNGCGREAVRVSVMLLLRNGDGGRFFVGASSAREQLREQSSLLPVARLQPR